MLRPRHAAPAAMERESWHYGPLVTGALLAGWGLYRIEDGGYGRKPCDIGGFNKEGRGVVLEVKVLGEQPAAPEPMPWKLFEIHQVGWLKVARLRDALPLVALFSQHDGRMKLYHVQDANTPAGALKSVELAKLRLTDGTDYWGSLDEWEVLL